MANKELSPELRVLLACGLSLLILLISRPLLVRNSPPTPPPQGNTPAKTSSSNSQKTPAENNAAGSPSSAVAPAAEVPAQPVQGEAEEEVVVESSLYRVVFSTRGAGVKSWRLKSYNDEQGHPLDLVNPDAAARYGDPLAFWTPDAQVNQQVNGALFASSVHETVEAPATVEFTYNSNGVAARKQFVFSADSYVVGMDTDLASDGKPLVHQLAWRGTFGDIHDPGYRGTRWQVFYRNADKMNLVAPSKAQGAATTIQGVFAFAGIEDRFFCAAFLPTATPGPSSASVPLVGMRVNAFKDPVLFPEQKSPTDSIGVAVGDDVPGNRLRLFIGPKQGNVLNSVNPLLAELVDYGWFSVIAKPLFYGLRWLHEHVVGNYGWDIILLTILINMALFPLKMSSMRSARKMQQLQPQLKAIQDKYKALKLRDPKRQQMSQETMELYKKHGVNPIGGCLPMLLQLPFLYAFYNVLAWSIEMRQAPWISWWVPDLSRPEPYWLKLLPLLMCVSQFALQRMTPTPSADPAQQKMMMFMPVMFLGIFYYISSGLVIYWLTGNVVGIAQQWYINRTEWKHKIEERRSAAERKKRPLKA